MKRLIACVFACLFLLCAVTPARATGETCVTVTPDKTVVSPGEEVTFTVSITGDTPFTSFGYIPKPDSKFFEVISGKVLVKNTYLSDFDRVLGGAVAFSSADAHSGDIFSFTVKIRTDAPAGEFIVTDTDGVAVNNRATPLKVDLREGKIVVVHASQPGDQTGNGENEPSTDATTGDVPQATDGPGSSAGESRPTQNGSGETLPQPGNQEDPGNNHWIIAVVLGAAVAVGMAALVIIRKKR